MRLSDLIKELNEVLAEQGDMEARIFAETDGPQVERTVDSVMVAPEGGSVLIMSDWLPGDKAAR